LTRENKTKYIILGLLSHEPQTGYDIRQTAENNIGHFWTDISYGQIYPTLRKLEKQNLVTKDVDTGAGQRLKKVYSITDEGWRVLREWLHEPADPEVYKIDLLLKLYFGVQGDIEDNIRHVREFRERQQSLIRLYDAFEENLRAVLDKDPAHPYILLTLKFGQKLMRANLEWANETLKTLESMK
jgi:DNA-binding PadR family transcriptional regulator